MIFDIVVIGGGHAGIESAHIAAKKNLRILLITNHLDLIGQMSCNPSIGGIAKGNIVREIDALGGLMGELIDNCGIHFKMLNKSKGSAVWGNRAQADKEKYRKLARKKLENNKNVFLLQSIVKRILVKNGSIDEVELETGENIKTKAVIVAAGTFLNGIIHIGLHSFSSGRMGEPAVNNFTESINELGIKSGVLKTGTSPRIDGRTINYDKMEKQEGDKIPWRFSYRTEFPIKNSTVCWISKTNENTHKIIFDSLDKSPLYTGKIKSIGPRYCPSIEDKIVRFGERNGHALFLEPENLENNEFYLNGLSTSLPFDTQIKMVKSIKGLENAKIQRPGYGIEYDYFIPVQLKSTLESKKINNLFFAGQINGTSGYEEAACQGLIAGINAAQKIIGEEELILGRDNSYIGVLIDDLVTRGIDEPYRMFTSRAEWRILLRQDNSDERSMPISYKLGYIDEKLFIKRRREWDKKKKILNLLYSIKIKIHSEINGKKKKENVTAFELLRRPEIKIEDVLDKCDIKIENRELRVNIESDIKYEGFIEKQKLEVKKYKSSEKIRIPKELEYDNIKGLSNESKQKLIKIQPDFLGQAMRIPGITPSDINLIILYISKYHHQYVSRETMGSDYELFT